jgi:uncharacterized membrane protein YphA (DoxX/SURF4 family)
VATYAPTSSSFSPTLTPDSDRNTQTESDIAWHPATRIAFRFCLVYFGLYVLTTQMMPGLTLIIPDLSRIPPMSSLIAWVGHHILGAATIPTTLSGSGDRLINWSHAVTLLLIASVSTVIWSIVARSRVSHPKAFAYFRLLLRLGVATTFLSYGFAKIFPLQMPVLALTRLVEPFGNFSPMGVLWYSVGAAPAYEIATGCAEVLAGILIFLPRTTTLGALVGIGDACMIFLLNMTYDVPVKLFSLHLLLMCVVILAPNAQRLFELLILHRPTKLRAEPSIVASAYGTRIATLAQSAYLIIMLGVQVKSGSRSWAVIGPNGPRSPLFGIWEVKEMSINETPQPALATDTSLVKRAIFQQPTAAVFQMMDDSFRRYGAKVDTIKQTLTLTSQTDTSKHLPLAYQRIDREHLLIHGMIEGRMTALTLQYRDPDSFLQRSRGFHFVQDQPFNR